MKISSVFTVTEFPKGKMPQKSEVTVSGSGQETMKFLRSQYQKYTKFVLEGFEVNGDFIPLKLNYFR